MTIPSPTKTSRIRTAGFAAGTSAAASLLWIALAWRAPSDTFHFAPLVATIVGPYASKVRVGPQSIRRALPVVGLSTAIVTLAMAVLVITDRMQGPTFWSDDGAALEATLFIALGSLAGLAVLVARRDPPGTPQTPPTSLRSLD